MLFGVVSSCKSTVLRVCSPVKLAGRPRQCAFYHNNFSLKELSNAELIVILALHHIHTLVKKTTMICCMCICPSITRLYTNTNDETHHKLFNDFTLAIILNNSLSSKLQGLQLCNVLFRPRCPGRQLKLIAPKLFVSRASKLSQQSLKLNR